jgi:hypothetical protein
MDLTYVKVRPSWLLFLDGPGFFSTNGSLLLSLIAFDEMLTWRVGDIR